MSNRQRQGRRRVRKMGLFVQNKPQPTSKRTKDHKILCLNRPGVYFVRWEKDPEIVKIGMASSVKDRLLQYLTTNPRRLEILGVIPTKNAAYARALEKQIHAYLSHHSVSGEWFTNCKALEDLIDNYAIYTDLGFISRKAEPARLTAESNRAAAMSEIKKILREQLPKEDPKPGTIKGTARRSGKAEILAIFKAA